MSNFQSKYFTKVTKRIKLARSIDNWDLWKQQTRQMYYSKYPKNHTAIDKFMVATTNIFDKHKRIYLPRKFMWYLWGKKNWAIKNNTHFWIAFVGQKGGEGKSTLADYFSMIMDPTYTKKRSEQDYDKWLKVIPNAKKETKYPAVVLDEPDVVTHDLSRKGRERRNILERIRILHLFVSVCANSLTSIPPSIYERLSAIVYINNKHRFWMWDSTRDSPKHTVVEDIKGKTGWGKYKHAVFKRPEFVKRACFKNLGFTHPKYSPFELKTYDSKKEGDVIGLINEYGDKRNKKVDDNKLQKDKNYLVRQEKKLNPHLSDRQIGFKFGISRQRVQQIRNEPASANPLLL